MLLTRSLRRRIVVAAASALAFAVMYESPIFDSEYIPTAFRRTRAETPVMQPGLPDPQDVAPPAPGLRLRFKATAYCKGTTTASGAGIKTGIAAADPDLLPVGSVIQVDGVGVRYNGIYTILDTGPKVQGRQIDIYMWNCNEALQFGRRSLTLNVMRLGWNPRASTPERVRSEFRRREAEMQSPAVAPPASQAPAVAEPGTTEPSASSPSERVGPVVPTRPVGDRGQTAPGGPATPSPTSPAPASVRGRATPSSS
jgi:3D (Asp-Asp-Asp) domain-containing protein